MAASLEKQFDLSRYARFSNTPTITIRGCKTNGQCISVVQQTCNLEIIDVDIVGASYGTALYLNGTSQTYNLYWGRVKNIERNRTK